MSPEHRRNELSRSSVQASGQQIVRSISYETKVIIMDEPTSSLQRRETATLFEVIRKLTSEGIALSPVSHKIR